MAEFGVLFFLLFIAIATLVIAAKTIKIVPQATVMLIERLGRFSRVATSGLNIIVPFLDKPRAVYWTNVRPGLVSIDLREQYIDLPPQPVITRDNVTIHVDSVVYWQITDPIKAVYEVTDLVGAIVQLTITGMRAVIGDMDLDHTLSSRDQINAKLRIDPRRGDRQVGREGHARRREEHQPARGRARHDGEADDGRAQPARARASGRGRQAGRHHARRGREAGRRDARGGRESSRPSSRPKARRRRDSAMPRPRPRPSRRIARVMLDHGNPAQYLITQRYIESFERDVARPELEGHLHAGRDLQPCFRASAPSRRCSPRRARNAATKAAVSSCRPAAHGSCRTPERRLTTESTETRPGAISLQAVSLSLWLTVLDLKRVTRQWSVARAAGAEFAADD